MMDATAEQFDVLIVGGGQAGAQVAISLRSTGFTGSIGIIESTEHPPYERPPLTKAYMRGERDASDLVLRDPEFWETERVSIVPNQTVECVNPASHTVTTASGHVFAYGKLVWAAGGHARELPMARGLTGVHSVRTLDDANELRARLAHTQNLVIIGGGFIGLEAASVFRERGANVTILEAQERLLARVTSPPVSEYFLNLHREHGATVLLEAVMQHIENVDGAVSAVVLDDGTRLPADLLLVGIGLVPNVTPLVDAGVKCSNGVDVDYHGRSSVDDIYAVGDCANRQNSYSADRRVRLESVPNAVEQGKLVADSILQLPSREEDVPWFWSHQYNVKLQTAGLFNDYDELIVRGDPGTGSFSVVYLRDGVIIALDCIDRTRDFAQGKALVKARVGGERSRIADPDLPLKLLAVTTQ